MTAAPSFVKAHKPKISDDMLAKLTRLARQARSLELELQNLEELAKTKKAELDKVTRTELPDLMQEIGMDKFGVPAEGNEPAYDLRLSPFYSANIAASWPPEKKRQAFDWLEANGFGDLIKTTVSVAFPRERREDAKEFAERLAQEEYPASLQETVHAQTLTAFLRERCEEGDMPPLETIGGVVGRIVKIKER